MAVTVPFVGRQAELSALHKRLDRVTRTGQGLAVALRGRRQVGKSRLVQEFCDRSGAGYFYFAATKGASPTESVRAFCTELQCASLTADPETVPVLTHGSWADAFRVLTSALPDRPAVVVLDELPWLAEQDETFDGALQTAWDRLLHTRPVLLLLLGSDLTMMARLTSYGRPFYGRADNMVLGPLTVAETADAVGLDGGDAVDAHLVSGGLPGIVTSWPHGTPAESFLADECDDPAAPVFSMPESALLAEFPTPDLTRRVLEAVGSGDRTRAAIASTAGTGSTPVPSGSLSPLLQTLTEDKRVLAVDHPLSTRAGKPALYRVADSNLRLYLAMLRDAQELARRGRHTSARQLVARRWPSWRGRAVEPLVRSALEIALASDALPFPRARSVSGWWNRQFQPEIDLVGGDRAPVAHEIAFVGSVKWLATAFDDHDLRTLARDAAAVPGFDPGRTGLVVVSRSGCRIDRRHVDLVWGPEDILAAHRD